MHSEQENNSFPAEFVERMKEMLGEEYPAFFESLGQERQQSFRINTHRHCDKDVFPDESLFHNKNRSHTMDPVLASNLS